MSNLKDRIEQDDLFLDSHIVSHGFSPHMRDYDFVIEVPAAKPDGSDSYFKGRYRYRFTHCPEVRVTTGLPLENGAEIWEWDWGPCWAYPGLSNVPDSALAASWSATLGREMHEVSVESNIHNIRILCHDLVVTRMAVGDPLTGEMTPSDMEVILPVPLSGDQRSDGAKSRVRVLRNRLLYARPE